MIGVLRLVLLACMTYVLPAQAQQYPDKQVRLVVPFPAGGTTDILARELAEQLRAKWGVPVVVDNKAGASGTLGSAHVVRAEKDGYTLLLTATHHVINPSLANSLPYDTLRDFTNVALVATVPNVLVVNRDFAARSVQDLIRMARENPGSINFASTGIGGSNHLSGELFAAMAGIKLTHVPYKCAAPAMQDLLGGHVPVMFDGLPGVAQAAASGRLRILGVTTARRVPALPDVPTIDESGVKGFEAVSWFGLYAPAQLPAPVLRKLHSDVAAALASPEIRKAFEKLGAEPGALSQGEFSAFVGKEIAKWSRVVEQANVPRQ